jgi:hypothetical protein
MARGWHGSRAGRAAPGTLLSAQLQQDQPSDAARAVQCGARWRWPLAVAAGGGRWRWPQVPAGGGAARRLMAMRLLAAAVLDLTRCALVVATARQPVLAAALSSWIAVVCLPHAEDCAP